MDWDSAGRREVISVNGQTRHAVERLQRRRVGLLPDRSRGRPDRPDHGHPHGRSQRRALGHPARQTQALRPHPTVESAPQGKWVNAVGTDGYDLAGFDGASGDIAYLPERDHRPCSREAAGSGPATAPTRVRLQRSDGLTRNAGTYYDANEIQLQLSFKEAYTGNLHLYAVDWDSQTGARSSRSTGRARCSPATSVKAHGCRSRSASAAGGTVIDHGQPHSPAATRCSRAIFLGDAGTPPARPKWKALRRANG